MSDLDNGPVPTAEGLEQLHRNKRHAASLVYEWRQKHKDRVWQAQKEVEQRLDREVQEERQALYDEEFRSSKEWLTARLAFARAGLSSPLPLGTILQRWENKTNNRWYADPKPARWEVVERGRIQIWTYGQPYDETRRSHPGEGDVIIRLFKKDMKDSKRLINLSQGWSTRPKDGSEMVSIPREWHTTDWKPEVKE